MAETSTPHEEKTPPKKQLSIEEILRPLLEMSGIKDFVDLELHLYTARGGALDRFRIRTYPTFLRTLGPGSYQITISEPRVEGMDSPPFKITFISVGLDYDAKTGWSIISVVTDWEEEIYPGADSEQLKDRASKIGRRIVTVLQFVVLIKDFAGLFGVH